MRINKMICLALAVFMLLPALISCGEAEKLNPADFGVDKFIEGHAKFVLGDIVDDQEFLDFAGDCVASVFCTCNMPGTFVKVPEATSVKWQINKLVNKSGYKKNEEAFLYPTPVDGNEPYFAIYTFDVDGIRTDYLIRASKYVNEGNVWKVEMVMIPNSDQYACVTSSFDDNEWHTVTKSN